MYFPTWFPNMMVWIHCIFGQTTLKKSCFPCDHLCVCLIQGVCLSVCLCAHTHIWRGEREVIILLINRKIFIWEVIIPMDNGLCLGSYCQDKFPRGGCPGGYCPVPPLSYGQSLSSDFWWSDMFRFDMLGHLTSAFSINHLTWQSVNLTTYLMKSTKYQNKTWTILLPAEIMLM